MKKTLRLLLVASLAITSGQTLAAGLGGSGNAAPACGAVICLSPAPGEAPPGPCSAWRAPFFAIRIFDPKYDPPKTAMARQRFLQTCSQAQPSDISRITSQYGKLFEDPLSF